VIESILVFCRSTPHHRVGGMETQVWNLAAEWAKAGVDVELVTTSLGTRTNGFKEDGVRVVPLTGTPPGRYSRAWWAASREHWLHHDVGPSVVFSASAGAYAVVRERARHPQSAFVLQAHGTALMELESKLLARNVRALATTPKNAITALRDLARYRDFDRIIAVGERVAQSLQARPQRWSVGAEKVRLIPNGVSLAGYGFDAAARQRIRAELGIDESTKVIASISRLHPQKRIDRALQAGAFLKQRGLAQGFKFLLVGDGPDAPRLRGLADDLGLSGVVHFVGDVSRDAVRQYYSAADVALLTTAWLEGLPMSVLEALACGLPCVVTRGSVTARSLDSVVCQAETAKPEELAAAVANVTRADVHRESLLPAEYLLEHCASAYLRSFEELLLPTSVG
jgi:glycosyltransferase involved in cell wall biosynthesis